MNVQNLNDEKLLALCVSASGADMDRYWAELFSRFHDSVRARIYGVMIATVGQWHDIDNFVDQVVSEVFSKLFENPCSFNPAKGKFQKWFLGSFVPSRTIDCLRKECRWYGKIRKLCAENEDSARCIEGDITRDLIEKEEKDLVAAGVRELPRRYRDALLLYLNGCEPAAAAAQLGLTVGAFHSRKHRAVKMLCKIL